MRSGVFLRNEKSEVRNARDAERLPDVFAFLFFVLVAGHSAGIVTGDQHKVLFQSNKGLLDRKLF